MKMRYLHIAFAVAMAAVAFVALKPGDPFEQILSDWGAAENAYMAALGRAKTADARRRIEAELKPQPALYAARLVDLAEARPDDRGALTGLCWAVVNAPETDAGRRALALLKDERIARADPKALGDALERTRTSMPRRPSSLAPLVLARASRCFGDPRAARLLTWVCVNDFGSDRPEESPTFAEAADMLTDQFADSPDISNFCEVLGSVNGSPTWGGKYENHLRLILEMNRTRLVRCTASYAMASIVQGAGELRQEEAAQLYEQFIQDFDASDPAIVRVERNLVASARSQLAIIRSRRLGGESSRRDGRSGASPVAEAQEDLTSTHPRYALRAGPG
ncbi:hypothetical protein [Paludisphaera borealis]|uniref:HEAT repeat domain-containing protein n=1 Tax=Paludisphaera borealis TaxID=1387353 RepID=A0A1U7CP42_9BACT|nr:hypothetical protein [Paludisphaera borealis]APW60679.1 hypothetical protein BSF38_02166 [Paludisphaera borealis]